MSNKKYNLCMVLTLSLLMLLVSCGGKKDDEQVQPKKDKNTPPVVAVPGNSNDSNNDQPILRNKWCTIFKTEQGADVQLRISFQADKQVVYTVFNLNPDQTRGTVADEGKGPWSIANDDLTFNFNNTPSVYKLRLDPNSPTGAPQLHLGPTADSMAIYDPCE